MTKWNALHDRTRSDIDHTPPVDQANFTADNIAYVVDERAGVAIAMGFTENASIEQVRDLYIPDEIMTQNGSIPVVGIANNAFYHEPVVNVHLGRNIEKVGSGVFERNPELENIYCFNSLTAVSDHAWNGASEGINPNIELFDKKTNKEIRPIWDNLNNGSGPYADFITKVLNKSKDQMNATPLSYRKRIKSQQVATEIRQTILDNVSITKPEVSNADINEMYNTFWNKSGWRIENYMDRMDAFKKDVTENLSDYCKTVGLLPNHVQSRSEEPVIKCENTSLEMDSLLAEYSAGDVIRFIPSDRFSDAIDIHFPEGNGYYGTFHIGNLDDKEMAQLFGEIYNEFNPSSYGRSLMGPAKDANRIDGAYSKIYENVQNIVKKIDDALFDLVNKASDIAGPSKDIRHDTGLGLS